MHDRCFCIKTFTYIKCQFLNSYLIFFKSSEMVSAQEDTPYSWSSMTISATVFLVLDIAKYLTRQIWQYFFPSFRELPKDLQCHDVNIIMRVISGLLLSIVLGYAAFQTVQDMDWFLANKKVVFNITHVYIFVDLFELTQRCKIWIYTIQLKRFLSFTFWSGGLMMMSFMGIAFLYSGWYCFYYSCKASSTHVSSFESRIKVQFTKVCKDFLCVLDCYWYPWF